jgi:UDP-2,3-diacylglucosamine hydrolase
MDHEFRKRGTSGPLAIICGSGSLPLAVADAAAQTGRRVVLFPLKGWADPAAIKRYPHHWVGLAQFGRFRRFARQEGCRDIVIIGGVVRPALRQLRPDFATLRHLPRIVRLFRGGDDHLLSGIGRIFEEHGFRLVGAHEAAPAILVSRGTLGRHQPSTADIADAQRGFAILAAMGPFDIGQAVVVAGNRVLAVEAAEGTDEMLARLAALGGAGRIRHAAGTGVLVKGPKPGQERRLDLPSIGARTVEGAVAAGLAGIAVAAGNVITADVADLVRAADAAGLFVIGVDPAGEQAA